MKANTKQITELKRILNKVKDFSGVDFTVRSRRKELIIFRGIYYKIARENTLASLGDIGKVCGGRDYATVINALKSVDTDLNKDLNFLDVYSRVMDAVYPKKRKTIVNANATIEALHTGLPMYIVEHLRAYSEEELKELYDTRLINFKRMVDSRVKPKEIKVEPGARLRVVNKELEILAV